MARGEAMEVDLTTASDDDEGVRPAAADEGVRPAGGGSVGDWRQFKGPALVQAEITALVDGTRMRGRVLSYLKDTDEHVVM